jgi:hypothetical protein
MMKSMDARIQGCCFRVSMALTSFVAKVKEREASTLDARELANEGMTCRVECRRYICRQWIYSSKENFLAIILQKYEPPSKLIILCQLKQQASLPEHDGHTIFCTGSACRRSGGCDRQCNRSLCFNLACNHQDDQDSGL